ncbi:uncharacterized protein LOC130795139 [Actinidia eriantha]|uniref:uncharacterized protein LOC130795139 n=1 Tax=Actinidia eriantha TaxID=165200 RepID=UPI002583409A|nr:uncharacterized protein LOC130795139 [Actinidia eriantha]
MEGKCEEKRMKILCLHGFRTSGSFLKKQISKWDPSIFANFHMEFPDGLYPAGGKSDIEGIFPPPYFEWFQFDKDFTEYTHLDECISYLCQYITSNGPFDGLLGFSQGATLSALLLGYQAQGKVLQDHPPFKLFVSISGSKFRDPSICEIAYKDPIRVRSVHFIGAKDWLRLPSQELAAAFLNPLIINHPQGHTVPRLDEDATEKLRIWTSEILTLKSSGNTASSAVDNCSKENGEAKVVLKSSGNTASSAVDNCSKENGETKVVLKISGNTPSSAVDNCSKENGETKVVDDPKCLEAVPVAESGTAILKTEEAGVAETVQA